MRIKRQDLKNKLNKKTEQNKMIIAAGVDKEEHEKWCCEAGCDFVLLYPTAKYENAQNRFLAGFLAFGNTNAMMEAMTEEMAFLSKSDALLAAVHCADPFKNDRILLEKIKRCGFSGIHNYPAMSLVDGQFGANLAYLHEGIDKEISLFARAKQMDLFTCACAATQKQATAFARAGVDALILYFFLGESLREALHDGRERIKKLGSAVEAIKRISKTLPVLLASENEMPVDELEYVFREVDALDGYLAMPMVRKHTSEKQIRMETGHWK